MTYKEPEIQSLSDLLREAGLQYRVYDLGRRIIPIPNQHFAEIEAGTRPYAHPLMQQAWMGIVFWDTEKKDHNAVWFLKLPLDEQGLFIPAARDDFLRRVLAHNMQTEGGDGLMGDAMDENPYAFKPADERMGIFHAKVGRVMGQEPSTHYDFVRGYLQAPSKGDWTTLGYQGIADVVARLDKGNNTQLLAKAIPKLPIEPLSAFCNCLESESIPLLLSKALADRAGKAKSPAEMAACIRGMSFAQAAGLRDDIIGTLLSRETGPNKDVLLAISNRAWESLNQEHLAGLFMDRLAECEEGGQELFNAVMADLLYMPGMRGPMLKVMRNPERPPHVAAAIGGLFKAFA